MRRNSAVRRIADVLAVINFFYFAATSLLVLYNSQQPHSGKRTYAALFVGQPPARWSAGSRLGYCRRLGKPHTLAAGRSGRGRPRSPASPPPPLPGSPSSCTYCLGAGTGLWLALNTTIRQQIMPTRLLGRMNAVYLEVSGASYPSVPRSAA